MTDELPDWIYEGAEVWVHQTRGSWGRAKPRRAKVLRFTATRILVEEDILAEAAFNKANLRGIGKAGDYDLIRADSETVLTTLRAEAVARAMSDLRAAFRDLETHGRIGWDELPDAQRAAELIHEASFTAIRGIQEARERYGPGKPRNPR